MEKQMNLCNGILIHNLPENLKCEAVKALEKTVSILASSMISVTVHELGVNIVFDGNVPFTKAITKRVLVIHCMTYHIYPMVTDLTVIGAGSFLTEQTLKSLMSNIAPVLSVYLERDPTRRLTNNYRVIMNHPEIHDLIKLWPLNNFQIPGSDTPFPITFFCRLCRQNGHTRHQCKISQETNPSDEKHCKLLKFQEERAISYEEFQYSPKQGTEKKRFARVKSYEIPFYYDDITKSKLKSGNPEEVQISQTNLKNIKKEKIETNRFSIKSEVKSYEAISFICDNSTKSKLKNVSSEEVKISQPILKNIKKEKNETHPLSVKSEANVHPRQKVKCIGPLPKKVSKTKADPPKKILTEKYQKIRFSKMIPPNLQSVKSQLKKLLFNITDESFRKNIYANAILFPQGINMLLHDLNSFVKFNVEEIETRSCQERRLIFWVDSMITTITKEHSKNDIKEHCPHSNLKQESLVNTINESYLPIELLQHAPGNDLGHLFVYNTAYFPIRELDSGFVCPNKSANTCVERKSGPGCNNSMCDKLTNELGKNKPKNYYFKEGLEKDLCMSVQMGNHIQKRDVNKNELKMIHTKKDRSLKNATAEVCNEKRDPFLSYSKMNQNYKNNSVVKEIRKEKNHTDPATNMVKKDIMSKQKNLMSMEKVCFDKTVANPKKNFKKKYSGQGNGKEIVNAHPLQGMDESTMDKISFSTKGVCSEKGVVYPGEKNYFLEGNTSCAATSVWEEGNISFQQRNLDVQEAVKNYPFNEVFSEQWNSHPATKNDFLKASLSKNFQKTVVKKPLNGRSCVKLSSGFLAAIRCSKGILKPPELRAFLIHVKGKIHVRQTAKNYSLEVDKIIEQLEKIVNKHYHGVKGTALARKEVEWIKELIGRLKAHENCEKCQK